MTRPCLQPRSYSALAGVALVVALLPLLAGLAMSASPEGREALAAWWARPNGWRVLWHTLAFATGAGAESRTQIGWVIVGGMSFGTLLTLFVVPTAYTLLAGRSHGERAAKEHAPAVAPVVHPGAAD